MYPSTNGHFSARGFESPTDGFWPKSAVWMPSKADNHDRPLCDACGMGYHPIDVLCAKYFLKDVRHDFA